MSSIICGSDIIALGNPAEYKRLHKLLESIKKTGKNKKEILKEAKK